MTVSLSFVSVICDDVESLAKFYRHVFDLAPVDYLASDHFRALTIGDMMLGFSATTAYAMLDLQQPADHGPTTFWTFEVDSDEQVDALTAKALTAGATRVKAPYRTYYGSWQAVLLDPSGNAFRINRSRA